MIIRILNTGTNAYISPNVARVVRVYNHRVPSGILESEFTQKGGILVGSAASAYGELPPGDEGQYLTPDPTAPLGLKYETPSIAINDTTNFLINGGFGFAQRTTPGTLTTVSDNAYGADRWKQTRENADLQYQRNDATAESGLTSRYYGKYRKITNAGKFMVFQILEGVHTVPLRSKTIIFQAKMKASSAKTIRMAIIQLQTAGTMDTIPGTFATAWNADSSDPTLGTNLAVVTGAESKSVTTAWQNFSVTVTAPSDCKNLICAVWSDADFSAADELNIAEAGLFLGASLIGWSPRNTTLELQMCQRYYWKSFPLDTAPVQNVGSTTGALRWLAGKAGAVAQYAPTIPLPVSMRTNATPTTYAPFAASAEARDDTAPANCTGTSATISEGKLYITCTANAATAAGNVLVVHVGIECDL